MPRDLFSLETDVDHLPRLESESRRQRQTRVSMIRKDVESARSRQMQNLFEDLDQTNGASSESHSTSPLFKFIDLFSGIGGLRIGLDGVGGQCVFSCEIDVHARKTYEAWFGEEPHHDVVDFVSGIDIPPHDILAAGFPCQPFSIAGVSKKNSLGRAHGFKDKAQGTLFFHLATIIENCQPPVLFLENVKNLKSHNKGDTWRTIAERLDELGYTVYAQVLDAKHWVPQHRERIFIIGFRRDIFGESPPFRFPDLPEHAPVLQDILEPEDDVAPKYVLTPNLWQYLQDYAKKHQAKGNGFGFGLADRNGITRTLSARYYKDGSEVLIPRGPRQRPRRLTILEAGRLMGFPEHLLNRIVVSDTQAYRQFGNAVVPKVARAIAEQIVLTLRWQLLRQNNGCLLAKPR